MNRAWRRPNLLIGLAVTGAILGLALLSLAWTPHSAIDIDVGRRLRPPSAVNWLGTDQFGRDVLSMIMVGARNSIAVGLIAVGIGVAAGVSLGLLAAARRGWTEEVVMRFADFTFAFPAVLTAIMITAIFGPGTVNSILAIGIVNVPLFARVARGSAQQIWTRDYVLAARAAGKRRFRITLEHVLPNILNILVVQATISFAIAILAEAALSYLGLGTQPPTPSWGRMLNEAQAQMYTRPMLAVFPGLAIVLAVLGLNLLGDGLRDLIDPKLARRR